MERTLLSDRLIASLKLAALGKRYDARDIKVPSLAVRVIDTGAKRVPQAAAGGDRFAEKLDARCAALPKCKVRRGRERAFYGVRCNRSATAPVCQHPGQRGG